MREARARTGVPGVAAGFSQTARPCSRPTACSSSDAASRCAPDTPFRIASISKPFTATLALARLPGARRASSARCSATPPGCAPSRPSRCREAAQGLWSYSNAGYWAAGERVADACELPFDEAMRDARPRAARPRRDRLRRAGGAGTRARAGGRDRAPRSARRRVSRGAAAVGRALVDGRRPLALRPRTTSTALRRSCTSRGASALGARYALGWWVRDARTAGRARPRGIGRPATSRCCCSCRSAQLALAVLTNSWRGSGLDPPRRRDARARCRRAASHRQPTTGESVAGVVRARRRRGAVESAATASSSPSARPIRSPARRSTTRATGAADRRRRLRLRGRRADEPPARLPARRASRASAGSRCRGPSP